MTQAWQRREHEQQEFIKNLVREILAEAEHQHDENLFLVRVAEGLIGDFYTADRRVDAHSPDSLRRAANQWRERVNAQLLVFSCAEEEVNMLKVRVLKCLLEMGLASGVNGSYLRFQVTEPERLYGGHGATEEVSP